ncbi:MAG: phosphotransferase, partial [Candidatus Woesearchaeota archaeon]|nr:phosphotransferase [Candidatus Woesearchaeota archaeon]
KIFPKNYLLLSKLVGEEMTPPNSAVVCKIPTSDELIRESGSLLAKIHSIKFSSYGWIIRSKISPKFSTWSDFVFFDLGEKINKLSKTPKIKESFIEKSLNYIEERKHLLNINSEPCLLHKDYHCSHIFANSKKITGIIDFEWSIAGHNELDLVKSLWWMFEDSKEHEKTFLKGYHKFGSISKKFEKRKKLYRLYLLIGLIGLSIEKKNKKWFDYNLKEAKEILK